MGGGRELRVWCGHPCRFQVWSVNYVSEGSDNTVNKGLCQSQMASYLRTFPIQPETKENPEFNKEEPLQVFTTGLWCPLVVRELMAWNSNTGLKTQAQQKWQALHSVRNTEAASIGSSAAAPDSAWLGLCTRLSPSDAFGSLGP